MATIELVTGDPLVRTVNLYKVTHGGQSTFSIPPGTLVKCAIVNEERNTRLTDIVDVLEGESGSDWSVSKLVVNIPKTQTQDITERGPAYLEVQVDDGAEITWFHPVVIIQGNIP